MKHILLLFLFLSCSMLLRAQSVSKDPEKFPAEVKAMMDLSRNEAAIATAALLETAWTSGNLSEKQKNTVMDFSQNMLKKKLRSRPYIENYVGAVAAAVNVHHLSGKDIDNILEVIETTCQKENLKNFEKFLALTHLFLHKKMLYTSSHQRIQVIGGTFAFEYRGGKQLDFDDEGSGTDWGTPEPQKEEPKKEEPKKEDPKKKKSNDGWGDDWGSDDWGSGDEDFDTFIDPKTKEIGGKPKKGKTAVQKLMFTPEPQPFVNGPVLVLNKADMLIVTPYDSVIIEQTSGDVALSKSQFVGNGGVFRWNLNGDPVHADLKGFNFALNKPEFKSEGAVINYNAVLENKVEGIFEFKSIRKNPDGYNSYPKFISYTNDARIKTLGPNIKYSGGFSLAGPKISTACLDGSLSYLRVSLNNDQKFRAAARSYTLGDTIITAKRAAVTIFMDKDTITHPAMRFKFNKPANTLTLTKDEGPFKDAAFYNSYQKMEIKAEMLKWDLNTPEVNFSILAGKTQVPAVVRSKNYYSNTKYQQMAGLSRFHPLLMLTSYATKNKSDSFYLIDVVQDTKLNEGSVRAVLPKLASDGFIEFNPAIGEITLTEKAWHYVNSARNKSDFDHISINSVSPSGKNATLNLDNNVLLVRGVERFAFSTDSGRVSVVPDSNMVRIHKNRDMVFNGRVYTQNFIFRATNMKFDYDNFLIEMPQVDTLVFRIKQDREAARDPKKRLSEKSLTNLKGTLYLNKPNNKSGRKRILGYPMFDATTGAVVYFNKPEVLGGVYDSSVYFTIPPFKLDSLGSKAGAIAFNGTFSSGNIFPDFKTKLVVMPDKSLGFEYNVPADGFNLYGNKGKLTNKSITMSTKGLQAMGELKYLNTTLQSDSFTFYMDSVTTLGSMAKLDERKIGQTDFFQASMDKFWMKWVVNADSMHLQPDSLQPMKMYNGLYTFRGTATVNPAGVAGNGTAENPEASFTSPRLQFVLGRFKGNDVHMKVKSKDPNKPAVAADGIFMTYDFKTGIVDFSPERKGYASTTFPHAQYKTSLSGGKWDTRNKMITMNAPAGTDLENSFFTSTRPDQYGLKFSATSGIYDLNKFTLIAGGVPHIASADAWIVPDSNKVFITEGANMKPFRNASITTDTINKYHTLTNGEIDVVSKLEYRGYATMKYTNSLGETFNIRFGNFTMVGMEPPTEDGKSKKKKGKHATETGEETIGEPITDPDIIAEEEPEYDPETGELIVKKTKKKKAPKAKKPKAEKKPKKEKPKKEKPVEEPAEEDMYANLGMEEDEFLDETKKKKKKKGDDVEPHTKAIGTVLEEDNMFVLPKIRFKGDVAMYSNRQMLDFDGEIKLAFAKGASADWFPYKNTVDPASVQINIVKPVAADGTPLKTGLHISSSSAQVYNTFVSARTDENDLDVFTVEGLLSYDKESKQFKMGSADRAYGDSYEGNMMVFNDETNVSRYHGKFNLARPNKLINLQSAGTGRLNLDSSAYSLNMFLTADIALPGSAVSKMGEVMADNIGGAAEAVYSSPDLLYKLGSYLNNKSAKDYEERTTNGHVPLTDLSPKLAQTLTFTDVKFRWSPQQNAWYSVGPLGLSNIQKKEINGMINGYIEIKQVPEGEAITIMIEANPTTWFYFSLLDNQMIVTSNDDDFNMIMSKAKGNVSFGEPIEKSSFVNYFRTTYLDGKGGADVPVIRQPEPTFSEDPMEESGKKPKKKKSKKSDDETFDGDMDVPVETAPEEEPAKKPKKSKKKDDAEPEMDTPVDAPAEPTPVEEEPAKKQKKSKKDKEADSNNLNDAPAEENTEIPTEEEEPKKKEKKPKKSKKSDEEPVDMEF